MRFVPTPVAPLGGFVLTTCGGVRSAPVPVANKWSYIWGNDFLSLCRPCLELQDLPASAFYGVELKHVLDDGMCKIQPLPTSLPNSLRGHGS